MCILIVHADQISPNKIDLIFLPTTMKAELDLGLASAATMAQHSTVALLTAWKLRILVELKNFPSSTLLVL